MLKVVFSVVWNKSPEYNYYCIYLKNILFFVNVFLDIAAISCLIILAHVSVSWLCINTKENLHWPIVRVPFGFNLDASQGSVSTSFGFGVIVVVGGRVKSTKVKKIGYQWHVF